MSIDLFACLPVRDISRSTKWYTRFLGTPPSFVPHDGEAVWELAEHRFLYIELLPEHAGHGRQTIFLGDFDTWIESIASRGLEPANRDTYANGVRKATYVDPDGNEIGLGGAPSQD